MLDSFLSAVDAAMGWLLLLPSPWSVVVLAGISAAAMVLVRRFVTDQDQLARCAADRKRLGQRIRAARKRGEKTKVRRLKTTRTWVQMKQLRAEGWPLLLSIPIIGVLGTWGYFRLEYHPPRVEETIPVELSLPASSVGSLATLVPEPRLKAAKWISRVEPGEGKPVHGIVRWAVRCEQPGVFELTMRTRGRTFTHPLRVGGRTYVRPVRQHHDRFLLPQSLVRLRPVKVLGLFRWFSPTSAVGSFLPAWLVTYILVVVPTVYLLKFVTGIH